MDNQARTPTSSTPTACSCKPPRPHTLPAASLSIKRVLLTSLVCCALFLTDIVLSYGHNVAATQTVLWARMLDRIHGPNPPQVIVVDPRLTTTAQSATVHIQPRIGTNVALLNGIQHLLIKRGYINKPFLDSHTIGYNDLSRVVEKYTPEYVESVTGVPAAKIIQVAEILGRTRSLLSTALQGVYQSNQATAAACQINNINLLLGHIGKPGSGIYQMNGQPTAQNNRESGCNGEYPGFRNNLNQQHMSAEPPAPLTTQSLPTTQLLSLALHFSHLSCVAMCCFVLLCVCAGMISPSIGTSNHIDYHTGPNHQHTSCKC